LETESKNDESTSKNDELTFASDGDVPNLATVEARASEDESQTGRENSSCGPSVVERLWLAAAAAFLIAAALMLLRSHTDAAFVTAALGVCAWFLNVRDRLKREHRLQKQGRRNWEPR
jgi:Flp pilus assembly protein TadB